MSAFQLFSLSLSEERKLRFNSTGAGRHAEQENLRNGGLFMGRRKLELAFGAISGAVGLLVALYTAVIATKD